MNSISEREQEALSYFAENTSAEELQNLTSPINVIATAARVMSMVMDVEHPNRLIGETARRYLRARAETCRLIRALCDLGLNPDNRFGFVLPQYWEALLNLADKIEDEETIYTALTRLNLWGIITL